MDTPSLPDPRFLRTRSVLAVRDVATSTRYYTDVLGFGVDPIQAPGWSFLSRDGVHLMLGECPDEVDASATGNHSWFLHVMVASVDALHEELRTAGAKIVVHLGDRAHGHREFVLETPDGHRILFAEPIGS
ncbi:MAG: VOC family protein [Gemmatimonadota bacterium]